MEETNMSEVVAEVKNASEEELREVIEKWFESTRTQGMRVGASYISAAIYGVIQKHTKKSSPSLRDYKRMKDEIVKIISVQLKRQETLQNDLEEVVEENVDDGTAE
jgi:vacuolar-type H+-ATPase subunit E/Vma4